MCSHWSKQSPLIGWLKSAQIKSLTKKWHCFCHFEYIIDLAGITISICRFETNLRILTRQRTILKSDHWQSSHSTLWSITNWQFFPLLAASWYPGDPHRPGPAGPRRGEAQPGGDGQEVRLRGGLLRRRPLLVAKDQAQDLVHVRRAILVLGRKGRKDVYVNRNCCTESEYEKSDRLKVGSFRACAVFAVQTQSSMGIEGTNQPDS